MLMSEPAACQARKLAVRGFASSAHCVRVNSLRSCKKRGYPVKDNLFPKFTDCIYGAKRLTLASPADGSVSDLRELASYLNVSAEGTIVTFLIFNLYSATMASSANTSSGKPDFSWFE